MNIKTFFDQNTATFTYIVTDTETMKCAVIDSVLDYDIYSGKSSTQSADSVIAYIKSNNLKLEWILETHIHADHLTASDYIKRQLGGRSAIGAKIIDVLKLWVPIFNTKADTKLDGSQFDILFADGDKFKIGNLQATVMYTPGHTPACACYIIDDCIFVGDTIFMPDIGTARTDFPGGSAEQMYDSIQKIFALPDDTKIYTCHDYPPNGRDINYLSTIGQQKRENILLNAGTTKSEYIKNRNNRDHGKAVPKLLLPSIQVNLRAGKFANKEDNGTSYIKIPVDKIGV